MTATPPPMGDVHVRPARAEDVQAIFENIGYWAAQGRMLVRPTRKAYRALPRFIAVSNALLDEAFAGFTPAEVGHIAAATERLRRNIGG